MADISHIKGPDNMSYDIKDATARNDLLTKPDYVELTQSEYDALVSAGTIDPETLYFIKDAVSENVIDDTTVSGTKTWSSSKLNTDVEKTIYYGQIDGNSPSKMKDFNNLCNLTINYSDRIKIYWCQLQHMTNGPESSGYGWLECISNMQRFTKYSTFDVYIRYYVNSTWSAWVREQSRPTTCSITKHSDAPSDIYIPAISRRGGTVIISVIGQFKANTTYYKMWNVTPAPTNQVQALISCPGGVQCLTALTDGTVRWNSSWTCPSAGYCIGQLVYTCN